MDASGRLNERPSACRASRPMGQVGLLWIHSSTQPLQKVCPSWQLRSKGQEGGLGGQHHRLPAQQSQEMYQLGKIGVGGHVTCASRPPKSAAHGVRKYGVAQRVGMSFVTGRCTMSKLGFSSFLARLPRHDAGQPVSGVPVGIVKDLVAHYTLQLLRHFADHVFGIHYLRCNGHFSVLHILLRSNRVGVE